MALFQSKNVVFGLDIGYETIKLVEVKESGSGFALVGFNEVPLKERLLERDHFKNINSAANMIVEATNKAKPNPIRAKKIVSALPESFVFSKTIQMPKMTKAELDSAVPIEAAQYVPIPIEQVYIDYQVLIVHPEESLCDILLVASPKKLVDDYVEMSRLAGFELFALETKPIAVGRAVSAAFNLNGVSIIEIGTEITRISIWDNNSVRLITSVPIGKNHIIEAGKASANSQFNILDSADGQTISKSIIDEIINTIKYHQNRAYKPRPITTILLCGSGAKITGIDQYFEKMIKLKTVIVNPKMAGEAQLGTEFITSYGLALRGFKE